MRTTTRLALDIGTNSIGWCLYALEDGRITDIIDLGVRIFSDGREPAAPGKVGASLAVGRRAARSMRRRRDRYLRRCAALMKRLAEAGLMPADPAEAKALEALDPYALRAKALDEPLPLTHLGRALFHLNQRRGFKSNRKTDRGDNEGGKIRDATARLDLAMMSKGARSYGEFLHMRRAAAPDPRRTPSVRTRLTIARRDNAEKEEAGYDFYPDRRHLEDEFNAIWDAQAPHRPRVLTEELRDLLFETIFFQRPLKEPEIGLCLFAGQHGVPRDERRLPKAHPLTQRRTLYETVNQLRVSADGRTTRTLTMEQRDTIILTLDTKKSTKSLSSMNFKLTALAKTLKLPAGARFTLETINRDTIACDPVRASLGHPDRFGARWSALDAYAQWEVVRRIRSVQSETEHAELVAWLMQAHRLDQAHAEAAANAPLPEGYGRVGETATRKILAALQEPDPETRLPRTYAQAVAAVGWHHSDGRTGEVLDDPATRPADAKDWAWPLPYYGAILERHVIPGTYDPEDDDVARYGRITNPTVHIGLNQLRRIVNLISNAYGRPDEIVVELARDLKQSAEQRKTSQRDLKAATEAAKKRSEKLEQLGQPDTGANRMILKLWEDLGEDRMRRFCPYTGTKISATMLFDGSCDVDHILPYSRTLDDSFANRTICLREANRAKRNQTPWEAWGGTDRWADIEANLKYLPENKRWRFAPDAMERFEGENNFLDRALVDTQYLSRIAKAYLESLYTEGGHVWVVPGKLTEMLRRHWGLNALLPDHNKGAVKAKNRSDHRHNAIDAAVIGAIDRGLVKRIADAAGSLERQGRSAEDVARDTDNPWVGFRDDLKRRLDAMTVSHRADHGRIDLDARKKGRDSTAGQLHNETAYGLTGETRNGVPMVVTRKPLDSLTSSDLDKIRDADLARALKRDTHGKEGKDFTKAILAFSARPGPYQGIRRVRLIDAVDVIPMTEPGGQPYKGYKPDSNHCYEVWRLPDGTWVHHVISTFAAHQGHATRPHPAAKRLLRLHKNDMVRLEESKFGLVIATVEKFDTNGMVTLVAHNEANADKRYRRKPKEGKEEGGKEDVFIRLRPASLKKARARRVLVDAIGRIRDPGPRD
ncbi:MAG: type II CRISPR RNA-guided endonuclease Cas9 [Pseudomonadota bacterium]